MSKKISFKEYSKDMMEELHEVIRRQALIEAEKKEKILMKELLQRIIEEKPFEWILL